MRVPKPSSEDQDGKIEEKPATEVPPLPQTLVRIPIENEEDTGKRISG